MKIIAIIPARMASSRFPGKPLAILAGRPMIEHVYRRAEGCPYLEEVYVATCDQQICDAVAGFGGKFLMTADTHLCGTDRVAEAARQVEAGIVVNIQGDEPLVHPGAIGQLCEAILASPNLGCVNLANVITREVDFLNSNQIKVVCDCAGNALYMSRQPIPTSQQWGQMRVLRQLGMIAFRHHFLRTFVSLAPTPLEKAESVDMLRAIEHGYQVKVVVTPYQSFGVDTPEDLRRAEAQLAQDELAADLFAPFRQ